VEIMERAEEFLKCLGNGKSIVEIEQEENMENSLEIEKLSNLKKAIDELEGIMIPFNIIKENIEPLKKWLEHTLTND